MAALAVNVSCENRQIEEEFTRFDVVADHSDHYYANTSQDYGLFANVSSLVHKNIMKQWKILARHLPETIYVRVYESRIDLLRAVIVGPAGTLYHDGLFFFDLAFPPDYPARPPSLHYKSFGLCLNPNLYANGYVCLSLLNTWTGVGCEKWNPAKSSVLQVLVSIQGLVLNEKPYFNEPGHGLANDKNVQRSLDYSDHVFILSCKTMLFLLRKQPKHFEDFIHMHFRVRATDILTQCDAYMKGEARVGRYR